VGAILGGNAPPEAVDRLKAKLGFDQPLIIRFGNFIAGALQGNFGVSLKTSNPVMKDIMNYFPATMELAIVAIIISIFLGITLGVLSAVHRNKAIDQFSRIFSILGVSMPVFWIGLLLLLVFYFKLGWLPGGGRLGFFTYPPPRVIGM